jgi:hypothetical protein
MIKARLLGTSNAPPIPWIAPAITSVLMLGANPYLPRTLRKSRRLPRRFCGGRLKGRQRHIHDGAINESHARTESCSCEDPAAARSSRAVAGTAENCTFARRFSDSGHTLILRRAAVLLSYPASDWTTERDILNLTLGGGEEIAW